MSPFSRILAKGLLTTRTYAFKEQVRAGKDRRDHIQSALPLSYPPSWSGGQDSNLRNSVL